MGLFSRLRNRFRRPDQDETPPVPAPRRPRLNPAWLRYALIVAALTVAAYFGVTVPFTPTPPDGPPFAFGWVNDPAAVKQVAGTLEFPVFADTPAGRAADPLPKSVFLWEAHVKVTGSLPAPQNQGQVGSCVAFGTARAVERSLAVQIARGEPFEFQRVVEEVIYAGSRVEVGGGRIRGDGSIGAWGAKYATEVGGALPRGVYGPLDLTRYSESRCRSWGDAGVPSELRPEAKKFQVGSTTQVRSWAEAKRALAQGYGGAVCSEQGFTMQRDRDGVCRPSGRWPHCLCLDGYFTADDGREYGHIENSWGPNAHSGPVGWGNPSTAGFWAESSVIDAMLKQNDSWFFSAVRGFPARKPLDWVKQPRSSDTFALAP